MLNEKLEKWAQQLLDMGKRNSLINFKDKKNGTAELVCPDSSVIFDKLCGDGKLEIFDPKLSEDDFFDAVGSEDGAEENDLKIRREEYINKFSPKLKKNQTLAYCSSLKPLLTVKGIDKKAKTAIEETGVNTAYIAFGFVHWKEREDSSQVFRAPLLLIPVTLTNDSSISPYYISSTDDDVTLNPTFLYKLESEYNVTLPEYDGEPLRDYLEKVGEVVAKLGWSVSAEAKLGIFSFLKINMYRDLKDNASLIAENGNVLKILNESYSGDPERQEENSQPLIFHNVVDADSSQLQAIEMAKRGKSFVLQGPPGTGKSQTITNILAECLMDGKRVLFVSEKLAALQVVYDKLKKADLAEFCLQLHSYKAGKKEVIRDLEHTLKLAKSGVSSKAETELAALERAKKQLDNYASELHSIRDNINLSLYGLYERYSALREYPDVEFVIPDLKQRGESYLSVAVECLSAYVNFIPSIGRNFKLNPWYGYKNSDTSYAADLQARSEFGGLLNFSEELSALSEDIQSLSGAHCTDADGVKGVCEIFSVIGKSDFICGGFLDAEKSQKVLDAVNRMKLISADVLSEQRAVSKIFDDDIYRIDCAAANKKLVRQFNGVFKRMGKEYKALASEFRLCKMDGKKPSYKQLVEFSERIYKLQEKKSEFEDCEQLVKGCLGRAYNGLKTDWGHIIRQASRLPKMLAGKNLGNLPTFDAFKTDGLREEMVELSERAEKLFGQYEKTLNAVSSSFDREIFDVNATDYRDLRMKICSCLDEWDKRTNWILFSKLLERMGYAALRGFIDCCIEHNVDQTRLVETYKKCFYKQWIDYILHGSEVLTSFNRVSQDAAVNTFSEKDKLQFNINRAIIKAALSSRRPDMNFVAGGSAVSVLLREAQKKRRQKPIRALLAETGELVQVLKPCFMMSPLSVSTFLDSEKIHFDTVVFDEASQIFPQDAVGAIYRGKQLIVVGDSKQMPPSNFFSAVTGSDEYDDEDEDEDINDFESILDLCSASMPQLRLRWHYRSRFEELISFSNRNFYEGDLVTFPSAKNKRSGLGVDYLHVDGVFDRRTKTNMAEAEYIAGLVFKNFETYPNRSLGVVAFSAAQQELIERFIAKRRREDGSKEDFFKPDREEPFFIKNLETVQGDERDTIIFSMAYARDAQGRFLANFGPLNRLGGERRLNVAVTRAKYNVQFVSSVHSFDIDLKGAQSEGARLLKQYLDFAENGMVALERETTVNGYLSFDSDFEREVYDFLTANGYEVDTQVGCSRFRIDLAVKRAQSAEYLLAIECDGATYHSSLTARDRDRLRQQILENMGWKFYRIWSTDWFRNNSVEKRLLLSAVKNASGGGNGGAEKTAQGGEDFVEDRPAVRLAFPKYKIVPVRLARARAGRDFKKTVKEILKVEAPLSEEWLLKRAVYLFDREKVTSAVYEAYEREMAGCRAEGIIRKNGFLYLQEQTSLVLRVPSEEPETQREIKFISPEELAYGLYEIVKHNVAVKKEGLYKELASQLGYSRVTDTVEGAFDNALKLLSAKLTAEDGLICIKKR